MQDATDEAAYGAHGDFWSFALKCADEPPREEASQAPKVSANRRLAVSAMIENSVAVVVKAVQRVMTSCRSVSQITGCRIDNNIRGTKRAGRFAETGPYAGGLRG